MGKPLRLEPSGAALSRISILLLLLLPCSPPATRALTCVGESFEVFPLPGDIPPNTVFVLQGRGVVATAVRGLRLDRIELRTPEGNYPLRIVERRDEPVAHIQFAPIDAKLREGQLELWLLLDTGQRAPQWAHFGTWSVRGAPDESYPRLVHQEDHAAVKAESSTWGESITASFSVAADEPSVYWLVSVDESENGGPLGRPLSFYTADNGLSLSIGPCGGNYPLAHGKQYVVDLAPVDAAGHLGGATAPSIQVAVP